LSLRLNLLVSIAFVLAFTLIVGSVLIYCDALTKVDTEMEAALTVGARTVQNVTDDAEEAVDPFRQLELLVEDFNGNRHVRAFLMNGDGLEVDRSTLLMPSDPAPEWFNHLLAHEPEFVHIFLPPPFNIKDTVKRAEAAKKAGSEVGIKLKEIVWTQGLYDLIAISEAPDEATATAFLLSMLKAGNLRAQTLRAFTAAEVEKILEKVA
jgi:two-component system, NarL family, sensor histidine kinase UhpB